MIDLRESLKFRHGLATFNNTELYYIVSALLGCGDFGELMIEKERLYVCTDEDHYINFFFIQTVTQPEALTYLNVGKFDKDFEEIEVYQSPAIPADIFCAEKDYYDSFKVSELLDIRRGDGIRLQIRSVTLVNGLLKLSSNPDLRLREMNPLFNIMKDDEIKDGFRRKYELYAGYDPETGNYKNFTGTYYLIAEPGSSSGNENVIIHNYELIENDNKDLPGHVSLSKRKLTTKDGKNFRVGVYD